MLPIIALQGALQNLTCSCFSSYRFTQIAVDPQVKTPGGKTYDVLFIGTGKNHSRFVKAVSVREEWINRACFWLADSGKVIKAVNAASNDPSRQVNPVVIEEIQVFNEQVRSIRVVKGDGDIPDGRLVVVSDSEVQALRLHRCYSDEIRSCRYVPRTVILRGWVLLFPFRRAGWSTRQFLPNLS